MPNWAFYLAITAFCLIVDYAVIACVWRAL
jgi:hypothetical protein